MKSIFTFASVAMMSFCAQAQPVVNASNVAHNFQGDLYYAEVPDGFSPGPAGPNRTWMYSEIGGGTFLGTQTSIPYATSPFASQFPLANYCYTMESAFTDAVMYFYHSVTPSTFEIYSLGYMGEVGEDFTQDPRTYAVFPYTYGTVFTDTYQRAGEAPATQTVTYDAYGTLIMPFGTFNNVVRQKVEAEGVTNYAWFNVNPFYPILQTALEDGILGFVHDNTQLGTGNWNRDKINAYPNPVRDMLSIRLPSEVNGSFEIVITDISGKVILNQSGENQEIEIDTQRFHAGIYLVSVISSEGATMTTKFVKS